MRARLGDVRSVIREEFLRGVPEFAIRQETEKYIEGIRKQVFRYILSNKSNTEDDRRHALAAANEMLVDLKEKTDELLEDALYNFMRQV